MEKTNCFVNKNKGILIVFEGISGCGKSEGVNSLSKHLLSCGYKTKVIEWNSNKVIRKLVQKIHSVNILTSWIYSILQWISFLLDYLFKLTPLLKKDYILIADRYIYTGYTRDIANGAGDAMGKKLCKSLRKPDILFFYDVDPEVCYERIEKRGKILFHPNRKLQNNKILKSENLLYLEKLRQEYLSLFHNPKLKNDTNIIYVSGSVYHARMQIQHYVEEYINLKSGKCLYIDNLRQKI